MNKILINGHLTADMEVNVSKNDKVYGVFSIANNEGYGDAEKTTFVKCIMWGENRVHALEEYLVKGCKVLIEGQLSINNVEDSYYTSITVQEIEIEKFKNSDNEENNKSNKKYNKSNKYSKRK